MATEAREELPVHMNVPEGENASCAGGCKNLNGLCLDERDGKQISDCM